MVTIDYVCDQFQRWADAYYRSPITKRPTRAANNVRDALRELKETRVPYGNFKLRVGSQKAEMMTAKLLHQVQQEMANSGRLCRRTVNERLAVIKRMFAWAAHPAQELVDEEIVGRLQLVKPLSYGRSNASETEPVRSVSETQVRATCLFASEKLATMIWVQWHTGMRPGELVIMSRSSIDMTSRPWVYQPIEHKTRHRGKDRIIVLGPKATAALEPWLAGLKTDCLFEGVKHGRTPTGQPMRAHSYANSIVRINEKHGLDTWTPNQIRHAYATRLEREIGKDAAKLMLDHSSDRVTDIYIDPDVQKKLELGARFN